MVDPYGINPLAEEMRLRDPARYAQVAAVKDPPKLFANGTSDVPAFTASGIDPELLLRLPVGIRHAAAANPDIVQVHSWFEDYAGMPEAEIDHEGLRTAKLRAQDWLTNTSLDTRSDEQRAADDEAEYAQYFGVDNDRITHATEQRRREQAGETPLEDFEVMRAHNIREQNQLERSEQSARPAQPLSDKSAQMFVEMLAGRQ